jgi:small-conductance mechanosensitive channel
MLNEELKLLIKDFTLPVIILLVCFGLARIFNTLFEKFINRKAQDANHDPTNYKFLRHSISAVIYTLGFGLAIYSIPALKAIAASLLAGAGIIAVSIGFASQSALSNIISGLFLVIYKPFAIKDRVEINGMSGVVEDITLRHTVIRNYENKCIVIPNAQISNEVIINSDLIDERVCKHIVFGISYDSNIDLAKSIIEEEALKHPSCIDPRTPSQKVSHEKQVDIRVINLGDSSVDLKAWVWAKDQPSGFLMKCDLLEIVKKRFDNEGIVIPYPHRTIYHKQL